MKPLSWCEVATYCGLRPGDVVSFLPGIRRTWWKPWTWWPFLRRRRYRIVEVKDGTTITLDAEIAP